jgi:YVTN family beta-propeller protein
MAVMFDLDGAATDPGSAPSRWRLRRGFVGTRALVPAILVALTVTVSSVGVTTPIHENPIRPTGDSAPTGPFHVENPGGTSRPRAESIPFGSTSSQTTLDLVNDTLLPGNFPVAEGDGPTFLVPDTQTGNIAIGSVGEGGVLELNGQTPTITGGVNVPGYGAGLVYDPVVDRYFAASGANLTALDPTATKVLGSLRLADPIWGLAADTSTGAIFVSIPKLNAVDVVDPMSDTVMSTLQVPDGPKAIAFNASAGEVAVGDDSGDVTLINGSTDSIITNVATGSSPTGILCDATVGRWVIAESAVAAYQASGVGFIDSATGQVTGTASINTCLAQLVMVVYPVTGDLFVACDIGSALSVIDPSTEAVLRNISTAGGYTFVSAAYNPTDGLLYFGNMTSNGVDLLNGTTYQWVHHIPTAITPNGIYADPANGNVYVAGDASNNISVVSSMTHSVIATVTTALAPGAEYYDGARGVLYVAGGCPNGVAVVDASSPHVTNCLPVPDDPVGVTYNPTNGEIFATTGGTNVYAVNATTGALVATIPLGTNRLLVQADEIESDPLGPFVLVTNTYGNNVTVIDTSTNRIVAWDRVGSQPTQMAYDPLTKEVLVVDSGGGDLYEINASSGSTSGWLPIGSQPESVGIDPVTDQLLVSYSGSGNLSVWNATSYAYETSAAIGESASAIAVSANGTRVFTASSLDGNVTVLRAPQIAPIGTVDVGAGPAGAIWDPALGQVVISNSGIPFGNSTGSGSLSFLDASDVVIPPQPIGGAPGGGFLNALGGIENLALLIALGAGVVLLVAASVGWRRSRRTRRIEEPAPPDVEASGIWQSSGRDCVRHLAARCERLPAR